MILGTCCIKTTPKKTNVGMLLQLMLEQQVSICFYTSGSTGLLSAVRVLKCASRVNSPAAARWRLAQSGSSAPGVNPA